MITASNYISRLFSLYLGLIRGQVQTETYAFTGLYSYTYSYSSFSNIVESHSLQLSHAKISLYFVFNGVDEVCFRV